MASRFVATGDGCGLGRAATMRGGYHHASGGTNVFQAGSAVIVGVFLTGCGGFESTESKQLKACIEDIKLGLNDPNSIEVLTTNSFEVTGGKGHRVKVSFTAKNKMGGRVRGEEICGFKNKTDTALDPDDYQNSLRSVGRGLRNLGIGVK